MTAGDLADRYDAEQGADRVGSVTVSPTDPGLLSSRLPVADLAVGSTMAVCAATDRYRQAVGLPLIPWVVDPERVAASFGGDRLLRVNGAAVPPFAELSGFFPTRDGWVRTHANYPHHRRGLDELLSLPAGADAAVLTAELRHWSASEVEQLAPEVGAVAVAVRTESEWADSDPGRRSRVGPLVASVLRPDGAPELAAPPTDPMRPLGGVRVLDLTRVIAGPIAGRMLALLGASVLRVDPPGMPEAVLLHRETDAGKANAALDVTDADDAERLASVLTTVDVVLCGYRQGSTVRAFLDAHRPGGAVVGSVTAWGTRGAWAQRRGFDSLVQAASGIAITVGSESRPGSLPVQALDHATGQLLAAGVVDALALRAEGGIGRDVSVSLSRTASWLLAAEGRREDPPPVAPVGDRTVATHGDLTTARPALAEYDDHPFPASIDGPGELRFP